MSAKRSMIMKVDGSDVRVDFDVLPAGDPAGPGYDWSQNHTLHEPVTGERLIGLEDRLTDDEWHEIAGDIDARMTPEILQTLQS